MYIKMCSYLNLEAGFSLISVHFLPIMLDVGFDSGRLRMFEGQKKKGGHHLHAEYEQTSSGAVLSFNFVIVVYNKNSQTYQLMDTPYHRSTLLHQLPFYG